MQLGQTQDAVADLTDRCFGIGDVVYAAQIGVTQVELNQAVEPQQDWRVIEARVATHARRDRQRLGRLPAAPQQDSVERLVVKIVESAIARQGGDDLGALFTQMVGDG